MSDFSTERRHKHLREYDFALGLAFAGVAVMFVGGIYNHLASNGFYFTYVDGVQSFVPALLMLGCYLLLLTHNRKIALTTFIILSAIGLFIMLAQSSWGASITDAGPAATKLYMKYTYVADVLDCLGVAMQLMAGAILALSLRNASCDNVRRTSDEETTQVDI